MPGSDEDEASAGAGSNIAGLLYQLAARVKPEQVKQQRVLLIQLAAAVQQQPGSSTDAAVAIAALACHELVGNAAKRVLVISR